MVRLGLIASVIPLALAGGVAPDWLSSARPCISAGLTTVQMASFPWQADLHVAFTERPELATVRVQLVDQPELADFVVMDDVTSIEDSSCAIVGERRRVAIATDAGHGEPVIYLSANANADYRIFVRSASFTAEQAAALIVGARGDGGHALVVSALTHR
jgi:hypothetical protein